MGQVSVGTTATDVGSFTTLLLDNNPTQDWGLYPFFWRQIDTDSKWGAIADYWPAGFPLLCGKWRTGRGVDLEYIRDRQVCLPWPLRAHANSWNAHTNAHTHRHRHRDSNGVTLMSAGHNPVDQPGDHAG